MGNSTAQEAEGVGADGMTERRIIINIMTNGFLIEIEDWLHDEQKWGSVMERRICTDSEVLLELVQDELRRMVP